MLPIPQQTMIFLGRRGVRVHRVKVSSNLSLLQQGLDVRSRVDLAEYQRFYRQKGAAGFKSAWGMDYDLSQIAELNPLVEAARQAEYASLKESKRKSLSSQQETFEQSGKPFQISNLFPKNFTTVLMRSRDHDELVLRPARFHLRPMGSQPTWDQTRGTYKARLESLSPAYFQRLKNHSAESMWRRILQHEQRGLVLGYGFFQKVPQDPNQYFACDEQPVFWPCVWDHWRCEKDSGHDFYSFALISRPSFDAVKAIGYARQIVVLNAAEAKSWIWNALSPTGAYELLEASGDGFAQMGVSNTEEAKIRKMG